MSILPGPSSRLTRHLLTQHDKYDITFVNDRSFAETLLPTGLFTWNMTWNWWTLFKLTSSSSTWRCWFILSKSGRIRRWHGIRPPFLDWMLPGCRRCLSGFLTSSSSICESVERGLGWNPCFCSKHKGKNRLFQKLVGSEDRTWNLFLRSLPSYRLRHTGKFTLNFRLLIWFLQKS